MTSPNFCPNCGEDLTEYKDQKTSNDEEDKPTREDYKRILNEELEKAEKPDIAKDTGSENSGSNLTREDYEEVLERKIEKAQEEEKQDDSGTEESNPEIRKAVKKLVEADREIIEHMRDGIQKDVALDIQDMAEGKTENLRVL